ncbi:unnamed protein product [Rotaria sordida]|uniref:N-acetyltransferase domain-containing protein n=1 Tax=Rotaria sordida TaxID=392033 RepID=A0A814NMZ6_9BILA|nr:unnamed protein product [Rotaria sordida]CAF1052313.1 unnamed protein product [Rotaria sordida]CAF1064592.1 unnamed protein product [Rotaria sordida]CAF1065737.1 unnamed protein product [Rotaria sordida]CAF1073705.1 unnamed protein product [Rotaria sordida]
MMNISDSLIYRIATTSDCDSLNVLINSSYCGELSHQGWTNADELILPPRTTADTLFSMIDSGNYVFLMFFGEKDQILKGCVHLFHEAGSKIAEIGMLAVRPDLQARGYGKFILSIAENYAVNNWNVEYIELKTFIDRYELTAYYIRRGYIDTGRRHLFPKEKMKLGTTQRDELEVCTMKFPVNLYAELF